MEVWPGQPTRFEWKTTSRTIQRIAITESYHVPSQNSLSMILKGRLVDKYI